MENDKRILDVKNLCVTFYTGVKPVQAVDEMSFNINRGEVLGVVGESGSGKSTAAMAIMRLITFPPGKITGGEIIFNGSNILEKKETEMTKIRGNKISMIFQEPMTSLNPVYTIGSQIMEAVMLHQKKSKKEAEELAIELLREVGISFPEKRIREYPHQMSGGMLQRAMIAMALSCNPELLIADEPTTALDVTIQAQILDLLCKLKEERGMSILIITHDMGVVAEVAKYIIVMYMGRIVEEASVLEIFERPMHPYTEGLLKSIPKLGVRERLYVIPNRCSTESMVKGCRFAPRCEYAMERCINEEPPLQKVHGGSRQVRCWLREDICEPTEKEHKEKEMADQGDLINNRKEVDTQNG